MTDHQSDAGVPCRGNDRTTLFYRRRDWLLDQHMNAAFDAAERQFAMQMGWGGDGDGIDACIEQRLNAGECRTTERPRNEIALLAVGVGHAYELHARQIDEDAGMIAAHDADAHHANA